MMIGSVAESTRTRRQTSMPSMPGSIRSSRTRSGRSRLDESRAPPRRSSPEHAVALALEREAHEALNGVLVVDHEDRPPARAHGRSLVRRPRGPPDTPLAHLVRRRGRGSSCILETMFPEGAPRGRRSRIASVRRNAARIAAGGRAAPPRSLPHGLARRAGACVRAARRRAHRAGAAAQLAASHVRRRTGAGGRRTRSSRASPTARPAAPATLAAADWVAERLRASGADVSTQRFRAADANGRTVPMVNVLGVVSGKGRTRDALVFIAGRDDLPPGPGANDNGSGTGALVELARTLVGSVTQTSLVFASVDGTTAESAGARELARHPPGGLKLACGHRAARHRAPRPADRPPAARATGTACPPRAGCARSSRRCATRTSRTVRLPSLGQQVAGLVAPVAHGDQAALVGRGAAVVELDGSRPGESSAVDTPGAALGRPARARRHGRRSSPRSHSTPGPRPASLGSTYLVSSDRVLRGWTLELFLVALLIPPVFALIDAAARARGARGAPVDHRCGACSGAPAGLALGVLAIRLAGRDGRPARHALAALRGRRRRRLAVAGRRSRSRSARRSARSPRGACRPTPTRPARAATSARTRRCSSVRGARVRRQRRTCSCSCIPALHLWLLLPATARLGRGRACRRRARGLARAGRRDRAARRRRRLRRRRAGVVRAPRGRRRHPPRGEPRARGAGLGDDRAAVARRRRGRRHPYGGWRIPAAGCSLVRRCEPLPADSEPPSPSPACSSSSTPPWSSSGAIR